MKTLNALRLTMWVAVFFLGVALWFSYRVILYDRDVSDLDFRLAETTLKVRLTDDILTDKIYSGENVRSDSIAPMEAFLLGLERIPEAFSLAFNRISYADLIDSLRVWRSSVVLIGNTLRIDAVPRLDRAVTQKLVAWIAFVAALAIWLPMSIVVRQRGRVQAQSDELEKAQHDADAARAEEKPFSEMLDAELHTVTERMRLNMVTSQNRADNLYGLGVFLMVASVFAPVASAAVYLLTNPLSETTLQALSTLRESFGGSLPDGLTLSVQRDWRLLVGGISFGFLFLAAARGLITQHTRQTATYFNLANEVAHYENLKAIIRLRIKAASSTVEESLEGVSELVEERLAEKPQPVALPERASQDKLQVPYQEQIQQGLKTLQSKD